MATLCKKYHLQVDELETLFVRGLSGWMSSASVCCVCVQGIMHHFAVLLSCPGMSAAYLLSQPRS